jgi:hypothetical protein
MMCGRARPLLPIGRGLHQADPYHCGTTGSGKQGYFTVTSGQSTDTRKHALTWDFAVISVDQATPKNWS